MSTISNDARNMYNDRRKYGLLFNILFNSNDDKNNDDELSEDELNDILPFLQSGSTESNS